LNLSIMGPAPAPLASLRTPAFGRGRVAACSAINGARPMQGAKATLLRMRALPLHPLVRKNRAWFGNVLWMFYICWVVFFFAAKTSSCVVDIPAMVVDAECGEWRRWCTLPIKRNRNLVEKMYFYKLLNRKKMRTSKFTKQQRLEILAKWDAGSSIDDLCREYQVSTATLYKWKKAKADEEDDALRELQQLRSENARLKKMYANLSMDHEILKEGYELAKKFAAQDAVKK